MNVLRHYLTRIACATLALTIANAATSNESELKSAYIFNFSKYTTVKSVDGRFVMGIVGDEPLVPVLEQSLSGKTVGGMPIVVKHLESTAQMRRCSFLFISSTSADSVTDIVSGLRGDPILTLGDTPGYVQKGVMINLLLEDNRVRFEVNIGAAKASHVNISSKLLSLAKGVVGN